MSETIDRKVVEMRFDNKDFEANTKVTLSTLDKLKEKLHFSGASKGLDEIGESARKVDFSGMSDGIETVRMKFSALQVIGITALQNITSAAMDAGKKIADAITIDPVKDGFAEYETQMNAVQTILANTQKEGTNIDQVNKALDELNTYADKTIYNFTEMTRNIGTFTAAGVKLDDSVSAIKGIANLAAVSGSTSQQASTAMYQLSQALAAGKVQLMDWNSVVNAGMGGQVFQDALIRTSEHLQTGAKQAIEAYGSFRESLTEGEWLTTDVLTETLNQIAGAYSKEDLIAQGYSESQAEEIVKLADTATDAATKVKTFTQLIDTLKEALGSGWTKTWQLVIGDFEEAKEVWTKVSDVLGGFINKAADARNAIVEAAMGNPYSNLAENIQKVTNATSDYKDIVDSVIRGDYGNGQPRFDKLASEGYDWARVQNMVNEQLGCSFRYVDELTTSEEDLNKETGKTIEAILKMSDAELKKNGFTKEDIKALKELQKQSEKTGIPINELINDMNKLSGKELLHGSVANIGNALINVFTDVHNAWQKVFDPISAMTLYNIIADMHRITSKFLKFTEDNGDELTRTLSGVFAILDILRQCLGGSFKFALKAINAILGVFGMNILDVTANAGDMLVTFDKWLKKTDPFTQAFTHVGKGIKFVVEQLKAFWAYLNKIPEFHQFTTELEQLGKSIKSLSFGDLKKHFSEFISSISVKIPAPLANLGHAIITELQNGLEKGKTVVPKIFAEIGLKLISAIKKVLGIASPSKETRKIGEWTVEGFYNGLKDTADKVYDFVKDFGDKVLATFSDIDIDKIFAGGIGVGVILGLKKLSSTVDKALSPAEGLGSILSGAGEILEESTKKIPKILNSVAKVIKGFAKVLRAKAFKTYAQGIKELAISIAILAGSLYVLCTIDKDFLNTGIEAMAILVAAISVLAIVMDKLSSTSASIGRGGIKIDGLRAGLAGIGVAVLLMATSVKMLGGLTPDEINQGMSSIGLLIGSLIGVLAVYGELVKGESAKNIDKVGKMISKIGQTMLLLVGVMKLVSLLSPDEMITGFAFAVVFTAFVATYVAMSKFAGDKIEGIGKMVKSIAIAMVIMVGVTKLAGKLSLTDMRNGLLFAAGFAGFVAALVAITKSDDKLISGLGKLLLSISVSMLIMVGVAKLAGQLEKSELKKAAAFAAGFLVFIYALKRITTASGEAQTVKLAGTLLAVSVAIGIIAGIATLLGFLSLPHLAKGVIAVAVLGVIMTALIRATRGANDVKGNILAMAVSIGVMAAAVAALSMIDSTKLAIATGCLALLMGMFALMEKAGNNIETSIPKLAAMIVAVAALAGILYLMSTLQVDNALVNAGALSLLLLALSATMAIVNKFGELSNRALVSLGVTTLVMGTLAGILYLLKDLNPESAIVTVASLSALLAAMVISMVVIDKVGAMSNRALISLGAMTLVMGVLAGILYLLNDLNPESSIANAIALSTLLLVMSGCCAILTLVGSAGTGGFIGIGVLAALIAAVGAIVIAIGALVKKFPQLEEFLNTGIPILEKIGYALGSFFGNIISGFAEGLTSKLPEIGENLSNFMKNVKPFLDGAKTIDPSIAEGVGALTKVILMLTAADVLNAIASFITGKNSLEKMGESLKPFGEGLAEYSKSVKDVDAASVQASAKAAKALCEVADSLSKSGGLLGKIFGNKDLSGFGSQLKSLGTGISEYSASVSDVRADTVIESTKAVKSLVEAVNSTSSVNASGVGTFVQAVDTLATTNISGLINGFQGSTSKVKGIGAGLSNAFVKGFSSKSTEAAKTASDIAASMLTALGEKEFQYQQAGVALISALAVGIQSQALQIENTAASVAISAASATGRAYLGFYTNGVNLGKGLEIGISAMSQSVYNAAYNLGQMAVKGEKDGQKSHSPSKLTIQAGKWLGEGLIIGINSMTSKTYSAGHTMGETAVASISKAISGASGLLEESMDSTPTIAPVLDLTNIRAGADELNGMFNNPSFTPMANIKAIGSMMDNRRQNGNSNEVVSAINKLRKDLGNIGGNTYNSIGNVTYDNGSEISEAIGTLVRAARIERRR